MYTTCNGSHMMSMMDQCEPDALGLLVLMWPCCLHHILPLSHCLPRTSCGYDSLGPPVAMTLSDLLWQCFPRAYCGSASRKPPVAITPSDLLWQWLPLTSDGHDSRGHPVAVPPSELLWQCMHWTSGGCDSLGQRFTAGPGEHSRGKFTFVTSNVRFTHEIHFQNWCAPPGFYPWCTDIRLHYCTKLEPL